MTLEKTASSNNKAQKLKLKLVRMTNVWIH
jgi:hypothetical protein